MSRTTRRAALGALLAAPAATLPQLAMPSVLASEPHPDAALFALVAEYTAAKRDLDALEETLVGLERQFDEGCPEYPDAMRRIGDFHHFYGRASNLSSPVFYTAIECIGFRGYTSTVFLHQHDNGAANARAAAIVAAYDGWCDLVRQHGVDVGLTAAEELYDEASARTDSLYRQVKITRPATLNGLVAKAQVWSDSQGEGLAAAICADIIAMGGAA